MSKATSVLFGIEDEFDVVGVERLDPGQVQIIIEMRLAEAPCPACGVFTSRVKDRPVRRVMLPASGQQTKLWWRKRRLLCVEALCPRRSFTQESVAIRPRGRVTERLRAKVAEAIAAGNRAVSEVAGEYGVSWPTAHRALIAAAAGWLPEPTPTRRLGIDETRFRSVRWILDGLTWKRSDPWLTSFVDCSRDGPGKPVGMLTGPYRRLRARVARRADSSVPRHRRAGGDRPVSAVRGRHPGRRCRRRGSRSTSGIWWPSPTR